MTHFIDTRGTDPDARAWRNFLEQRGDESADLEIRRLAATVAPVLKAESPNLFADVEAYTAGDGFPAVRTRYRKV